VKMCAGSFKTCCLLCFRQE